MGTWAVPFSTPRAAREFAKRMASPWMAKVSLGPYNHEWDAEGLHGLVGSDALFDELGGVADLRESDFDVRPYVADQVAQWLPRLEKQTTASKLVSEALEAYQSKQAREKKPAVFVDKPFTKKERDRSQSVDTQLDELGVRYTKMGLFGRQVTRDRARFVALLVSSGWKRESAQYLTKDGVRLNFAKPKRGSKRVSFFIEDA